MNRSATARWLIAAMIAGVVIWRMMTTYDNRHGSPYVAHGPLQPVPTATLGRISDAAANALADSVTITVARSERNATALFNADIVLINRSATSLRDLTLRCDALDASGALIEHATIALPWIAEDHHQSRTTNITIPFVHADVAQARCSVLHYTIAH
ncbi:MAG TPA: hypothetical protein VHW65_00090 [Gemmatimonadales bacterium]|jgi:hypothetical protein|nr:hypothetical protein [Gemmatimonadales bacterium]